MVADLKINPRMITLARESRGITQRDLAELLSMSTAKICQVEQDNQSFSDEIIERLSEKLNFPVSFFYQDGEAYLPSSINFRKRLKVPQKVMMPIEAQCNIYRLNVETIAAKIKLPPVNIPSFDGTPQEAAQKLRKLWNVPAGTIENMTDLLEAHGIIIVSFDFGTERVDSRACITKGKHPLILVNKSMLGDRLRFSLAYELGHLVMHTFSFPDLERDIDHEANMFAAEFLMPEKEISKEIPENLSISTLANLKKKWKVSMQALLYRASDLELISYNQKRYLIGQFNALKIRRREPVEFDIPVEKSRLFRDLITKYRTSLRLSVKEMAEILNLNREEFLSMYGE